MPHSNQLHNAALEVQKSKQLLKLQGKKNKQNQIGRTVIKIQNF